MRIRTRVVSAVKISRVLVFSEREEEDRGVLEEFFPDTFLEPLIRDLGSEEFFLKMFLVKNNNPLNGLVFLLRLRLFILFIISKE